MPLTDKAAEQTQIALAYQHSADAKRKKHDGVVVTPVEIVDFQIRSVLHLLAEQGREPDDHVEWLDPFGGTGIYTARLLQIVDLPPHRKRALAANCVVIEIDPAAAQVAANNLARVHLQETGEPGEVRVICIDTLTLSPTVDLWDDRLPLVHPATTKEI